jgi:hypothetical protein
VVHILHFRKGHIAPRWLSLVWNFFCGANYLKLAVNITPEFKNKYTIFMKRNQTKSTMGVPLNNGRVFQLTLVKLGVQAENKNLKT